MKGVLRVWVGLTAILVMGGISYLAGWGCDAQLHGYWSVGSGPWFWAARIFAGALVLSLAAVGVFLVLSAAHELGARILEK